MLFGPGNACTDVKGRVGLLSALRRLRNCKTTLFSSTARPVPGHERPLPPSTQPKERGPLPKIDRRKRPTQQSHTSLKLATALQGEELPSHGDSDPSDPTSHCLEVF